MSAGCVVSEWMLWSDAQTEGCGSLRAQVQANRNFLRRAPYSTVHVLGRPVKFRNPITVALRKASAAPTAEMTRSDHSRKGSRHHGHIKYESWKGPGYTLDEVRRHANRWTAANTMREAEAISDLDELFGHWDPYEEQEEGGEPCLRRQASPEPRWLPLSAAQVAVRRSASGGPSRVMEVGDESESWLELERLSQARHRVTPK